MKLGLAVLLGLSVYNDALSQKNPNLKGQNRLLKGVEQYRLIVKFSQDEIIDIDNNKLLARTASKQRLEQESLVNKHSFRQVFSYSQSDRKAMRGPDKPTVAKGKFNHYAFRGLAYVNGAEKMDKNALLKLANDFEKLPSVEYAVLQPVTLIAPPSTPDLTSYQHYKYDQYSGQGNVYGIDAEYAWSIGITGQSVKIADIEWGFNYQHEDLTGANFVDLVPSTRNNEGADHGTAVAGIMYAKNNGIGMTGMVYGSDKFYGISEFSSNPNYQDRIYGITQGMQVLGAGDVFVYEMQAGGVNGYVPADYDQAVWDITKAATDAGIIVVAAAGNGSENLDAPEYANYRARGDNGSIRVGAGTKVGRDRASFSTYGTPIHLHGWGDWTVAATGYGDLYDGGPNATYTNGFSGTSSATPIVASAVVAVQSYAKNVKGTTLTPLQIRALLISTGTQQGSGGHIGPLPNIRRAIESLAAGNTICAAPAWNATTTYLGDAGKGAGLGEVVSYSGKQYRAKWWTQNNTPGTSDVWLDLGTCGTANIPPTVGITSPTNNEVFNTIPATINISAEADDRDGSVSKVEFFNGTAKLGEDLSYPYTFSWTNVAAGNYAITAKATDNNGATTTSATVNIIVAPPANYAPVVTITSPADNSKYVIGGSLTITANVTDPDNDAISKVEFWSPQLGSGSTITVTTPPYTATYAQLPAANPQQGGLTFVVKAYDARGAIGGANIFVNQDKVPTVTITSPAAGSTVPAGNVTIIADAYDAEGLTRVDFLNAVGAVVFSDFTAPYEYLVSLSAGNYTYRAIAYDNVGQSSTTSNVSFTVTGTVNLAPVVTFTAPAKNSVFPANTAVTLVADAVDPEGYLNRVEFYNQSGTLVFTDYTAPYQYTTAALTSGNYIYTAVAFDNPGLASNTASNNFTISQPVTCTAAQWNANTAYNGGQVVQYSGIRYQANWWTQNQRPDLNSGVSGSGQPWTNLGTCNARAEAVAVATLSVYPNPVSDILNITIAPEEIVRAEIRNLNGELVLAVSNTSEINVSSLAAGLYTISIQTANNSTTQKFVKQ